MQGLQERLQRQADAGKPLEKLLFVARDGFLFERLYRTMGMTIPAEYVYLSRRVITAAATAEGLTREQALVAFYNPKQQGLASVCKVYGLPEAALQPLATQHGFVDFSAPIHDWDDVRLHNFLQDQEVQAIIRATGQQHRALLQRYLEQVGFLTINASPWWILVGMARCRNSSSKLSGRARIFRNYTAIILRLCRSCTRILVLTILVKALCTIRAVAMRVSGFLRSLRRFLSKGRVRTRRLRLRIANRRGGLCRF